MNKSQFIKYLRDGGKIQMLTFHGQAIEASNRLASIRKAEKVQTNAVRFEGGSWLQFDSFKASDFKMEAEDVANLGWCTYKLIDKAGK